MLPVSMLWFNCWSLVSPSSLIYPGGGVSVGKKTKPTKKNKEQPNKSTYLVNDWGNLKDVEFGALVLKPSGAPYHTRILN